MEDPRPRLARRTSMIACAAHGLEPEEVETVMVGEASHLAVDVDAARRRDGTPGGPAARPRGELVVEASEVAAQIFGGGPSGEEMLDRLDRTHGLEQFWVAEAGDGAAGRHLLGPARRGSRAPSSPASGAARRCPSGAAGASTGPSRPPAPGPRSPRASATSTATARAMSRPILERSGLVAVTTTTPYVWHR